MLPENKVALLSNKGCNLIRINPDGSIGKNVFLSLENGKLAGSRVREVFTDGQNDVWFLTNTGITNYNYTFNRIQHFFHQAKNKQEFNCSLQTDKHLYFGSNSGSIWYRVKGDNSFYGKQITQKAPISDICILAHNTLMISTLGEGVYVTDFEGKELKHFTTATHPELGSNRVHSLYVDKNSFIWLDAETSGVVYYDTKQDKLYHKNNKTELASNSPSARLYIRVLEGNNGQTWVYTRNGGFFTFDSNNQQLQPFSTINNQYNPRNFRFLTDALVDKDGNLWISTGEPRLEKITVEPKKFNYTSVTTNQKGIFGAEIRTLFEDGKHRIWVCDKEGKIQVIDGNGQSMGYLHRDGTLSSTVDETGMMVYDMIQDKKGRLWMACKGAGVVLLHEKNGKTPVFSMRFLNANSTLCYALLEDKRGRIWVGTFGGGLNLVDESTGSIRMLHHRDGLSAYPADTFSNVRDLAVDKTGAIWVATDNGLVAFDSNVEDPKNIKFYSYRRNGMDAGSLRTNDVHCIHIDKQNNRWFGTFGGGLNKLDSNVKPGDHVSFDSFTQKDGLPSDIVMSIEEDFQGFLWLFSENSITRFDTKTSNTDVYNKDNGLDPVIFSESSTLLTYKGDMYAGTINGYYRFNPSFVKKATYTSPLYFTGFYLYDEEILPNEADGLLSKNLDETDRIVLKKEQSIFSIEFAALDFRNPNNIQYAYKLEPIDADWVLLNKLNRVTFSRLNAGQYTLKVRSTNSEGVWMSNERSLRLLIQPSIWETTWAIIFYVLVGGFMVSIALMKYMDTFRSRSKVSLEKKVGEAKKQLLANVTRELRVPLMLIEGPIEQVSKDKGLSFDSRNNLSIVQRNIDKMMRLVNRILDFQKNQDRKMTLMVEETPIGKLCEKIAGQFELIAQERNIRFQYSDQSNGVEVYLDKEKFDTILHILLTNAIKFTQGEKTVTLSVHQDKNGVSVKVADEGAGISKENMPFIFDGLNVMEESDVESGIGIGLSLAKELVELHGGSIHATSQEEVGTTFELHFKLGKDHFPNADIVLFQSKLSPVDIPDDESHACLDQDEQHQSLQQQLFIVVEQLNPELPISTLMANHFRVATCRNTPQAWSEIDRLMPDYIIIDNDASGDGGFSLIEQLKENERTCHIPVILVANRSVDTLSPSHLPEGVSELISKPFNASYLEARMEQIFLRREQWREKLRKDMLDTMAHSFATTVPIEPFDAEFLSRVKAFLIENLSNSKLTVSLLISVIGLGKNPFVSKLRGLLGLSPKELIREVRLKHAMELLVTGRYNVSEVVIRVGMTDVDTFSKCFLQHVGLSPYEYRSKAASLQK